MKLMHVVSAVLAAVVVIGLSAQPAAAGSVRVPEPGTFTLLSSAVGVGILGYRWLRRR